MSPGGFNSWNFFPCSGRKTEKTLIFHLLGPKRGPGVKFTENFFLPKHATDPKVSFGEIKFHVPWNFFPCSGRKTEKTLIFSPSGAKTGSGGEIDRKFFFAQTCP